MKRYYSDKKVILLFILPALIVYVLLEIAPVLLSSAFSFCEWPGILDVPMKFVGLKNFIALFSNAKFWVSIKNILLFVGIGLITQLPIGFFLALLLSSKIRGTRVFKAFYFVPMVLPTTATGLIWYFILYPNEMGLLNGLLSSIGLSSWMKGWLIQPQTAMICIILITTWASVGYYMVIGLAAFNSIDESILESAALDGANEIQKTFYIKIPMVKESIMISIVMIITGVLKVFDIVFVMTEGGPNGLTHVPATLLYYEAFKYNHYGTGSAISVIIFILGMAFTLLSLKVMNKRNRGELHD